MQTELRPPAEELFRARAMRVPLVKRTRPRSFLLSSHAYGPRTILDWQRQIERSTLAPLSVLQILLRIASHCQNAPAQRFPLRTFSGELPRVTELHGHARPGSTGETRLGDL